MLQQSWLAASKLPFALNRQSGCFNICWAKSTPVFLFLLSSRPELSVFLLPPCFWPPLLLLPFLIDLTVTKLKQHLGSFWFGIEFSDTTNHKVRGYKYRSKSEFLFHEADPEGCGFYPWLVIAADLSGPKWVEATATWNCTTLHFTLSYNLCGIIALWVLK